MSWVTVSFEVDARSRVPADYQLDQVLKEVKRIRLPFLLNVVEDHRTYDRELCYDHEDEDDYDP